jgi:fructan beta-fructosidase
VHDKQYVPEYHFSVGSNWTGEPSGMLYYDGEYHLFYQYNPSDVIFGNIHWGHAISKDLIKWKILPTAISPDKNGYLNSGSVVVDIHNTSGFGHGGKVPFIAFYTYANSKSLQALSISYSLDKGLSWVKSDTISFPQERGLSIRNPHVFWNKENAQWVMLLSVGPSVRFYKSSDCKHWTYLSDFYESMDSGINWEMTDFFPLKVENSDVVKWILLVSMEVGPVDGAPAIKYYIGDFDGVSFHPTQYKDLWLDYGKDDYSGMTFNTDSVNDRIFVGWMNCWEYANLLPTYHWRGSMTFPRSLSLNKEGNHYIVSSKFVSGLEKHSSSSISIPSMKLSDKHIYRGNISFSNNSFLIKLEFDNRERTAIWHSRNYGINLITKSGKKLSIGYDGDLNYYYIDRRKMLDKSFSDRFDQLMGATYRFDKSESEWYIFCDKSSVEFLACDGRAVVTSLCYPDDSFDSFEMFAHSGNVSLLGGSILKL